jgi:hypothetical protein
VNSYDRMKKACYHYTVYCPEGKGLPGYTPTHFLLDVLDKRTGIDTTGGRRHNPFCGPPHGQPKNYVGTRLRLHEELIRPDYFPGTEPWDMPLYFWGIGKDWH